MHNDFRTKMSIDEKTRVHHYMIVLVDGETTYQVSKGTWEKHGWIFTRWEFSSSGQYYLEPGNIKTVFYETLYQDPGINYCITGNGSSIIYNSPHVAAAGALIRQFESGAGIKSYLIGYASDLGTHINSIGNAMGTDPKHIYRYDDPDFDLEEVFKSIATDIMADFWIVTGPQIME
jgi:hypothetical protein